jgi:hypothetical protein
MPPRAARGALCGPLCMHASQGPVSQLTERQRCSPRRTSNTCIKCKNTYRAATSTGCCATRLTRRSCRGSPGSHRSQSWIAQSWIAQSWIAQSWIAQSWIAQSWIVQVRPPSLCRGPHAAACHSSLSQSLTLCSLSHSLTLSHTLQSLTLCSCLALLDARLSCPRMAAGVHGPRGRVARPARARRALLRRRHGAGPAGGAWGRTRGLSRPTADTGEVIAITRLASVAAALVHALGSS